MTDTPPAPLADYRPDGTIHLHPAAGIIRLRRPTLGEFRRLREALHTTVDTINAESAAAAEEANELQAQADKADAPEEPGLRAEATARVRALSETIENARLTWLQQVVATLGDRHPLADADIELWMVQPGLAVQLVEHWRAVPSRSGVAPR